MTAKEFAKLKSGSAVVWREGTNSPRAGEITERGVVKGTGTLKYVQWPDGQTTDGHDDWALLSVEVPSDAR